MDMLRFLGLAALMFAAAFLGMNWYLRVEPLPDPHVPTVERADADGPASKLAQSSIGDGDPTRDRLRHEVLDYAKALNDDPCNPAVKHYYIKAVVAYARAWLSIAPCAATRTCDSSDSQKLERARRAFGSPLDVWVRDAMADVRAKGIFGPADFPKDTVRLVAELATDGPVHSAADTKAYTRPDANAGPAPRQDCGN